MLCAWNSSVALLRSKAVTGEKRLASTWASDICAAQNYFLYGTHG